MTLYQSEGFIAAGVDADGELRLSTATPFPPAAQPVVGLRRSLAVQRTEVGG